MSIPKNVNSELVVEAQTSFLRGDGSLPANRHTAAIQVHELMHCKDVHEPDPLWPTHGTVSTIEPDADSAPNMDDVDQ